jgi:hypothetical protein
MGTSSNAPRGLIVKHLLSVFALVIAAAIGSAAAADPIASAGTGTPRIGLGDSPSSESIDPGRVVFHNEAPTILRLRFGRNAEGVNCQANGDTTTRVRAGQYTLAAGAELLCDATPGKYRYETMTASGGAIQKADGKLVVR